MVLLRARAIVLTLALAAVAIALPSLAPPAAAIIGGHSTSSATVPWQAAINLSDGPDHSGCGAVIVSPSWILTSAHCVKSADPSDFQVYTGLDHAAHVSSYAHSVDAVVIHRDYDPDAPTTDSAGMVIVDGTVDDDIAMVHLRRPLRVSALTRPVFLPSARDEAAIWTGDVLSVSGWGQVSRSGGRRAAVLQSASVRMLGKPGARCGRYRQIPPKTLLCAGRLGGGVDSCDGDSGGPLTDRVGTRTVLIGLVSTGQGCADPRYPGLYTRVRLYVPWIVDVMSGRVRR
jgi:secreted trypsin-like serine protease